MSEPTEPQPDPKPPDVPEPAPSPDPVPAPQPPPGEPDPGPQGDEHPLETDYPDADDDSTPTLDGVSFTEVLADTLDKGTGLPLPAESFALDGDDWPIAVPVHSSDPSNPRAHHLNWAMPSSLLIPCRDQPRQIASGLLYILLSITVFSGRTQSTRIWSTGSTVPLIDSQRKLQCSSSIRPKSLPT